MVYDESTGKYAFNQYGKVMVVGDTEDPECFTNVIIMLADITELNVDFSNLADELTGLGKTLGLDVRVMHEEIFNSMHRI